MLSGIGLRTGGVGSQAAVSRKVTMDRRFWASPILGCAFFVMAGGAAAAEELPRPSTRAADLAPAEWSQIAQATQASEAQTNDLR